MSTWSKPAFELPPRALVLLADRVYDADWFRMTLLRQAIAPCIPQKESETARNYAKILHKQCHKDQVWLSQDWRRIASTMSVVFISSLTGFDLPSPSSFILINLSRA